MKVIPVQTEDVSLVWHLAAPLIQKAIDKTSDSFRVEDVRALIEAQKAQLWLVADETPKAAWVTTVESSPSSKWVRVMWAGGEDAEKWLPLFEGVEQWAKNIGASKVVIYGRKGWIKKLPTYRQAAVVLEKKL